LPTDAAFSEKTFFLKDERLFNSTISQLAHRYEVDFHNELTINLYYYSGGDGLFELLMSYESDMLLNKLADLSSGKFKELRKFLTKYKGKGLEEIINKSHSGSTPLFKAAGRSIKSFELLVSYGADFNIVATRRGGEICKKGQLIA
jgi:hypothetical protein